MRPTARDALQRIDWWTSFAALEGADAVIFVMAVRFEKPELRRHEVAVL